MIQRGIANDAVPDSDADVISAVKGCPLVTGTAGASCSVTETEVVVAAV